MTQNKMHKLESELLKPYLSHAINSVWYQAAATINKALLVCNLCTTWKTKHPWIQISFRNGAIVAEILITVHKNEKTHNCHSANRSMFSRTMPFFFTNGIFLLVCRELILLNMSMYTCQNSDVKIFQKSRSHLKILGTRTATWSKFHT
jgi:hypothetical protein